MKTPVIVVNTQSNKELMRRGQITAIKAAKAVADLLKSSIGPTSMLKMMVDPIGGIVLTNDGNTILREVEASHPAAKCLIELARTQSEQVGDGTSSVIILAGEILNRCISYLEDSMAPSLIIAGLRKAINDIEIEIEKFAKKIDLTNKEDLLKIAKNALNTKLASNWSEKLSKMALESIDLIAIKENEKYDIDIQRLIRIEKIPGDNVESSKLIKGIILNKDITHPGMRRYIKNPRIILLDCTLEYKKGESQTNIEITRGEDWRKYLAHEEKQIKDMCDHIIRLKPDILCTEKGVSDIAQHYLLKANITAIRRLRKTDNLRLSMACGARIINRPNDLVEEDVGTGCGLFHIEKIGDEYYSYFDDCNTPKACTILLRGPSKDLLNEIERDLYDALYALRNIYINPYLVPGGGAIEMALSNLLFEKSKSLFIDESKSQLYNNNILTQITGPYSVVAASLESIPMAILFNTGRSSIKLITDLRAKHSEKKWTYGINGLNGEIIDMDESNLISKNETIWDPLEVKFNTFKSAIEAACMILRVDNILSGNDKNQKN